jgi:hypothetical protein
MDPYPHPYRKTNIGNALVNSLNEMIEEDELVYNDKEASLEMARKCIQLFDEVLAPIFLYRMCAADC